MMSKNQKLLMTALWCLLLCGVAVMAAVKWVVPLARAGRSDPPPVLFPAAEYELTDQHGNPFSSKSLAGKPYVASFMFTRCQGVCPTMNTAVAILHKDLPEQFQFVSFTVDPANDTVPTLSAYAAARGVQPGRWHFLTGDLEKLRETALGMKVANKDWPAGHSDRLILVDASGNIRGTYHSLEPESVKQLVADAKAMIAKP